MRQVRHYLWMVMLAGTWTGILPAAAQYTSNYQTNTINGVTTIWAGDYVVGSNTFGNGLMIRNGGVLSNATSYAGYLTNSSSNHMVVSGAGSVWSNAGMYLGYAGGGNSLAITNAGRIANSAGVAIGLNATSSSNQVLIAGTNSAWDCANYLSFGDSGPGNSLIVSNGGRLSDTYVLASGDTNSSGNSALVTGTGSVWSNSSFFVFGHAGNNNKLTVNKGGRLYSDGATIGEFDAAGNNSVLISDSGSLWDDSATSSEMQFGSSGSGNGLIVSNGGQVLGYFAYFGRYSASDNNYAVVTGPGSIFSVNCYVFTGNEGHNNTFTLANGATVSDKFCYISYVAGSSNNAVLVTGANSSWQNSYSTLVGVSGGGGSLTISNGATMSDSDGGVLGYDTNSGSNRVLITGGGSVWNCASNLFAGYDGPANSLVISNGGQVIDEFGILGTDATSQGNSATVTGAGSVWTNSADVYVGYSGPVNSLLITNGGRVNNYAGRVGLDTNSSNNTVLVTGAGSVWSNTAALLVGDSGSSNSLVIGNDGRVVDQWGLVGEEDSSSNNSVLVQSGGVWSNLEVAVGDLGSHNAVLVQGGSVYATNLVVGYDPLYYNNLLEVDSGQVVVTNQTGNATLEVYGGSLLLTGGTLRVDTLIVTNAGAQFFHVGGTLIARNTVLDPAQSVVGDGIPNGWKQRYGLDPFDPNVAAADTDGDGMSNWQEYLAGTDPTKAASRLAISSISRTNNDLRVSWLAVGGKSYVLQRSSEAASSFADASPVIIVPGTNETTASYLDPGTATNGQALFYRVRLAQ